MMKTMWRIGSKVLLVSWLGVLGASPAMASDTMAPPAEEQEQLKATHVEMLRMGQEDDSFEGMLVELESGQIIYEQSGKGAEALAQYRKAVDTLAPPELRIQLQVPRGVPQGEPVQLPSPPCAEGDETAWIRFAVHLTSDYLAMERPLFEKLSEEVNFVEILELDAKTNTFTGMLVDSNTRQILYKATGDQSNMSDYDKKVEALASKNRRARVVHRRDWTGSGSLSSGPPIPPGPTGHDWIQQRFLIRTVFGFNSARVEDLGDALQQK